MNFSKIYFRFDKRCLDEESLPNVLDKGIVIESKGEHGFRMQKRRFGCQIQSSGTIVSSRKRVKSFQNIEKRKKMKKKSQEIV